MPTNNPGLYHARQLLQKSLKFTDGHPEASVFVDVLEFWVRELIRDELHAGLQTGLRDRFRKEPRRQ